MSNMHEHSCDKTRAWALGGATGRGHIRMALVWTELATFAEAA